MRTIPTSKATKFALVDDEDYEYLSQFKWSYSNGYAIRRKDKSSIGMHRIILNPPKDMSIDHINHNRLDNRKENLRICTHKQNSYNQLWKKENNHSKYKGVTWAKHTKRWKATIKKDGKVKFLGYFNEEIKAAEAYNKAALICFGNYAKVNKL